MKNRLLPLFVALGSYSAYSQVGVGIVEPNSSAQLDITSSTKGLLIPRVPLTSSTDAKTIKPGNVESLLVYNTETIADITPGFYYWYIDKWLRIATSGENVISPGVANGNGVPAKKDEPGYPGKGVIIYIDKLTGDMYVQNPVGSWIKMNSSGGASGINGINGQPGKDGVVPSGSNIVVDNNTGTVYILSPGADPAKPESWIPLNGKHGNNGKDGINGINGEPGKDAVAPEGSTIVVDNTTGTVYILTPGAR